MSERLRSEDRRRGSARAQLATDESKSGDDPPIAPRTPCAAQPTDDETSAATGTSGPDWDDVRRAFETETTPAVQIARRFGVARSTLRRRAIKGDWRRPKGARWSPARERDRRKDMLLLMEEILSQEFEAAEARIQEAIAAEERLSLPDRERNVRTLSNLVKTFEKVIDMKRQLKAKARAARDGAAAHDTESASADEIRQEIKRRLDRLVAELRADGVAGEPERGGDPVS